MEYHRSVMLQQCIEQLAIVPEKNYIDATLGGGGHTLAIANQLTTGQLFSFDQDLDAVQNFIGHPRVTVVWANFSTIKQELAHRGIFSVAGILVDLGISAHQIDVPDRGFSFRFSGPLDMRMNTNQAQTAAIVLNEYSEEDLAAVLWKYGNVPNSKKIAHLIVKYRQYKVLKDIPDLLDALRPKIPKYHEYSFLAPIFQAIRIEVNQEIKCLHSFLEQSLELLETGGRLVTLTYHSVEDRLVKIFMKTGNTTGSITEDLWGNKPTPFKLITQKALIPSKKEVEENSRARSAKLRTAQKR